MAVRALTVAVVLICALLCRAAAGAPPVQSKSESKDAGSLVLPPSAATTPGYPGTCQDVPLPTLSNLSHPATQGLRDWREKLIAAITADRAYQECLRAALTALKAKWKADGHEPDQVVLDGVAIRIQDAGYDIDDVIKGFNAALHLHNQHYRSGDPDFVPRLVADDLPPPPAAPAPDGLLSVPAMAVGSSHDCSRFYPEHALDTNKSGQVEIGYDIGADGAIDNVHVLHSSGTESLDNAAVKCANAQWRDVPAVVDGVAVAAPGRISVVTFQILR